jgi:hypothetical protein
MDVLLGIALTMHLENRDPDPCVFCEVVPFSNYSESDYNNIHPHIRLQEGIIIAGAYLNNEGTISPYVGNRFSNQKAYFEYGLVSGYKINENVIPFYRIGFNITETNSIFFAPSMYKNHKYGEIKTGTVIGLELMY